MTTKPEDVLLVERLKDALEARDTYLEPMGCTDGDCKVYNQRRGQHTNGGCRCLTDHFTRQKAAYANNFFADKVRDLLSGKAS